VLLSKKPRDEQQAFQWFLKAAQQGFLVAQGQLVDMYLLGQGTAQDKAAADEWNEKFTKGYDAEIRAQGCNPNPSGLIAKELELMDCQERAQRRRASRGSSYDEWALAVHEKYAHNPAEAIRWYKRAAEAGSNGAAIDLASMYEEGANSVKKDYKKATDLYLLAARRGSSYSQYYVGGMYEDGKGVPKNDTKAVYWYQSAAAQGDPFAAHRLGYLYSIGRGVPQDDEKALYWAGSAACFGLPEAKSLLEYIREHPGGMASTPPTAPDNTSSLGATIADDLRAYKACLEQHSGQTSKCDALEKAYKADLEWFRALYGAPKE
jgi:hypothetical protein